MANAFLEAFERAHRRAQEAFNAGDYERAFAGLDDEVEWDVLSVLPDAELLHGRDAVLRFFRNVGDGIRWETSAVAFTLLGPRRVLVHQRGTAVGRTTNLSSESDFFQIWEVGPERRTVRVSEFTTREEALAADARTWSARQCSPDQS